MQNLFPMACLVSIKYDINEFIGGKIFFLSFCRIPRYRIESEAISRPIGAPYYQYPALCVYQLTEAERGVVLGWL
jgi:hypothetical protein